MLRHSLGRAVIFISLQHFILPYLTYCPACKQPEVRGIAIRAVSQVGQNKVLLRNTNYCPFNWIKKKAKIQVLEQYQSQYEELLTKHHDVLSKSNIDIGKANHKFCMKEVTMLLVEKYGTTGGNCNLQFPPLLNNLSLDAPLCSARKRV